MENHKLKTILNSTVYASLCVQIATGFIDLYVYFLPAAGELAILKKMLKLEIFVQIVEGTFYTWLATGSSHIKNITPHRYYDWAITTPIMLFTFCLYLDYLGEHDKKTKEPLMPLETGHQNTSLNNAGTKESPQEIYPKMGYHRRIKQVKDMNLWQYLLQKKKYLLPIFVLNWIMLMFGYLGEIGYLDNKVAVICGFLPFIVYFAIIYDKFSKYSSMVGRIIFWIFFAIWALYGVAALATYYWKNIAYNILDLFAKNFFGIVLAYTLYMHL